ncbi:NAD(+) diphosphatase [Methanolobus psychrotolerans]|uniref:NAD(+) diphosphatase n=1 Tax=Methanolobus psychrotolerans TaxID=1874706 RepID=UPI000B9192FC|nr:NAD(+) diphosphatase [Methanolobus psychrotolerans]
MNTENRHFNSDFLPLVTPPQRNGNSDTYCFAFKQRELLLVNENGDLRLPSLEETEDMGINILRKQYLGELKDVSCFSMELDSSNDADKIVTSVIGTTTGNAVGTATFVGLRELPGILEEPLAALAGKAVHIMEWDRNTIFCGRCGSVTSLKENERAKECPECGFLAFPKISPAIIVLIEKEDQILLARSPNFKPGLYSNIAGFVEPGESIEQAVVREVMEEVGISVKNIRYFGSQPWPYPDSLMIGFTAEFLAGEIKVDGVEIEEARWFRKEEIPFVPRNTSISGWLIKYFINRH